MIHICGDKCTRMCRLESPNEDEFEMMTATSGDILIAVMTGDYQNKDVVSYMMCCKISSWPYRIANCAAFNPVSTSREMLSNVPSS